MYIWLLKSVLVSLLVDEQPLSVLPSPWGDFEFRHCNVFAPMDFFFPIKNKKLRGVPLNAMLQEVHKKG